MITSYAQNFEDVMLWRALKHVENGVYIDVGAQHPVNDSVSLAFYEHGWRGMHVEPNTHYAHLLRESRPDETVIQAAVIGKGAVLRFFEIADTGLSTCDAEIAEQHRASGWTVRETSVPCITLANVFESCADREIHWLKIDVEGLEEQVLQGWQPSKARPWIVVLESIWPLNQIESHGKWEKLILDLDYQFVYFDGLNRYYLTKTHPELKDAFRAGPNVFDGFVLSGTSSAPFCSFLNNRLALREQELGAQVAEGQAEVLCLTQALRTREHELGAEVLCLTQALRTREHELGAKMNQAQGEAHRLGKENIELSRMLKSLHGSLSIRLTAPLRMISRMFRGGFQYIVGGPNRFLLWAKGQAKNIFRWVGPLLRDFHVAKKIARFFRVRYPKLWNKLWYAAFCPALETTQPLSFAVSDDSGGTGVEQVVSESGLMPTRRKNDKQLSYIVATLKQEIARQRNL